MKGTVNIVTTTDGKASEISRRAECTFGLNSARICYREESASVQVILQDGCVDILRKGDYGMSLHLVEGETSAGTLEMGGKAGELCIAVDRIGYSVTAKSLLLKLQYAILFGEEEKQEINLRLYARGDNSEEK